MYWTHMVNTLLSYSSHRPSRMH